MKWASGFILALLTVIGVAVAVACAARRAEAGRLDAGLDPVRQRHDAPGRAASSPCAATTAAPAAADASGPSADPI